jgi:hypothetical protein
MDETLVWTQGADGNTAAKVVAEFARCNWDRPRKATMLSSSRFRLADGVATYRIRLEPGGIWAIYRYDDQYQDPHPLD